RGERGQGLREPGLDARRVEVAGLLQQETVICPKHDGYQPGLLMRRKEVRREIELSGGVADVERKAGPEGSASVVGARCRDETAARFPRAGGIGGVEAPVPTDVVGGADEVARVYVREAT